MPYYSLKRGICLVEILILGTPTFLLEKFILFLAKLFVQGFVLVTRIGASLGVYCLSIRA